MEFESLTHSIGMAAQVFFLDLLLSGDNALAIAVQPLDDETREQAEAILLKLLIWIAIGIGVLGLGWIIFHLMSQGFMPVPAHQPKMLPLMK